MSPSPTLHAARRRRAIRRTVAEWATVPADSGNDEERHAVLARHIGRHAKPSEGTGAWATRPPWWSQAWWARARSARPGVSAPGAGMQPRHKHPRNDMLYEPVFGPPGPVPLLVMPRFFLQHRHASPLVLAAPTNTSTDNGTNALRPALVAA